MNEGLEHRIEIASAGTHDYHVAHPPDRRTQAAAAMRGYVLAKQRARQVSRQDFLEFDYILAMDRDNLSHLQSIAPSLHLGKAQLFLDYKWREKGRGSAGSLGGQDGFTVVLDLVEDGAVGLLADIKKKLGL